MTLTDIFTRLCGAGQSLDGVTTAGVLSTNWVDLDDAAALNNRALGGGQLIVARFGVTVNLDSATENATIDLQIVQIPKTTIAVLGPFNSTSDVDDTTETITLAAHGLINGTRVTVAAASGALPTGLVASTSYYVRDATTNTFKLSLTPGGAAVNLTDAVGTTNVTWYPEIVVAAQAIGLDRLQASKSAVEIAIPPPQVSPLYPVGRYLFARFVPSATLATPGGTMTCDLVGGYAMEGKPFNKNNYTTA